MKFVLCLALLGLSAAAENGTTSIGEILDQAHVAPVTGEDTKVLAGVDCYTMHDECKDCLRLGHCRYAIHKKVCFDIKDLESIKNDEIANSDDSCPEKTGQFRIDPRSENASTSQAPSTTSDATTTASDNTTTTTPPTTTTTAAPNTTTTETTTTTTATTTTSTMTTTQAPNSTTTSTTPRPTPTTTPAPEPRGNTFDGWSFFGGMLLTIGISAIGYVSLRYYKARIGQTETNYNRF